MNRYRLITVPVLCLTIFLSFPVFAGPVRTIAFVAGPGEGAEYQKVQHQIIEETNAIMKSRGGVVYQNRTVPFDPPEKARKALEELMNDPSIDCLIGVGIEISDRLIRQRQYARPVIAAGILDHSLQGLRKTSEGSSGILNFNYIESHFDVEKDLKTFKSLYDFKRLAVLIHGGHTALFHTIYSYFGRVVETIAPDASLSIVEIDPENIAQGIPQIPPDADAVYLLPLFTGNRPDRTAAVIREINRRKLPSFALIGEAHVRLGAMAAIAPDRNINVMARRIAINVLDILEGRDAGTLPVSISRYAQNFVINVETLRDIDYYPSWKALGNARLLNLEKLHQGPKLQLKGVILDALERNLDYLVTQADTRIQEEEAGMARGALLPQVGVSAGLTQIDENRVEISQTYPARTTLKGSASLSQTLFTDDILANYTIQKILTRAQHHQEETVLLDTVLTAARAYINLLLAKSVQAIQNDNLKVTRKNLEIARNKAAVGTVNAAEVSRWESEQAANMTSLNDAFRDLQLARMTLNQVLDRPITRDFTLEDIGPDKGIELMITDPRVYGLLNNIRQVRRFSNFLIAEADRNLPALRQIRENIRSQERQVLNRERALYLPDVAIEGSIDKILDEYDARQKTSSDLDHPWTIALTASWPLFTGGSSQKDLAQSRYRLKRLKLEERNLRNQYHLNVRSGLETAAVSAREIELSENGYAAATRSFEIIQAGYAEGRNSVTELVDAQNAKLSSERALASARYQFVLDFLEMERATGRFYFLESPELKQAFLSRLNQYMETTPMPRKDK